MMRPALPRLWQHAGRVIIPSRAHSMRSRWLPIFRASRSHHFDDIFRSPFSTPHSLLRMVEDNFRNMQKLMEETLPRSEYSWGPAWRGREVEVRYDSREFEVKLDVVDYAPEELQVKLTEDSLVVSAKHHNKEDQHGYVSREFTRQFNLPENVEADTIESTLTADGHLVIKGRVRGSENTQERVINIQREEPSKKSDKNGKDSDTP